MSQKKVDENKKLKQNRKKIVKRQRRMAIVGGAVAAAIAVVIVGWLVYSVQKQYQTYREENPKTTEVNLSAIAGFDIDSVSSDAEE